MSRVFRRTKELFSKLIPSQYLKDSAVRTTIYKWLLIGLLIRLAFMPFTIYFPDLLGIYYRSSWPIYHDIYWIGGSQIPIHYFHTFFLWIFKPLMPYWKSILYYADPLKQFAVDNKTFEIFTTNPYVFRTLFLFKVPYLVFELGCILLLLRIFQDTKKGLRAYKFWIVNPIVIFATYIAARYESIAIFFILLSLYYAKKNRSIRSLLSFGVSIVLRVYPLILLPFFIIVRGKKVWGRFKLAFWGILPLAVLIILTRVFHQPSVEGDIVGMSHVKYFLGMKFPLFDSDVVFVFVVGYALVLFFSSSYAEYSFERLWKPMLVVLLLFFATSHFHVHYFMWLIPFLTFQVVEDRRFIPLFAIQVFCFIVYTWQWDRHFLGYLFTPLHFPYFAAEVVNLKIFIGQYFPFSDFLGIFRSIFSAVSFYMIYLVIRRFLQEEKRRKKVEG